MLKWVGGLAVLHKNGGKIGLGEPVGSSTKCEFVMSLKKLETYNEGPQLRRER